MNTKFIIIPDPILFNKQLNVHSKVLFGLIYRMTRSRGYCWATNAVLGEYMQKDERSVRRWIRELELAQCITIEDGDSRQRKIYAVEIDDLTEIAFLDEPGQKNPATRTKKPGNPDTNAENEDKFVRVSDDLPKEPGQNHTQNPDTGVLQNNIKKNTRRTSSTIVNPDKNAVTLFNQPPPSLSTTPQYWIKARDSLLTNRIFLERMCMAKKIAPDACAALLVHFCNDLELREDWDSYNRLQSHFIHWYNKGITEGFILPTGVLKNQPAQTNEHQAINPREKTANDILLQFGDS